MPQGWYPGVHSIGASAKSASAGFEAFHDPFAGLILEADVRAGATFRWITQGTLKRGFGLPDSLLVICNLVIGIDLFFHQIGPDFLARHRFRPHSDGCDEYARPIGLRPTFPARGPCRCPSARGGWRGRTP